MPDPYVDETLIKKFEDAKLKLEDLEAIQKRDLLAYKLFKDKIDRGQPLTPENQWLYSYVQQQIIARDIAIKKAREEANRQYPNTKPGNLYTHLTDSQQTIQEANKLSNKSSPIAPIDDYVNPRKAKIEQDIKTATQQQANLVGQDLEDFKKSMKTNLEIDEQDPGSLSNSAILRNTPDHIRALSDRHQAEMIRKHVPALSKTTAINNDPPKKAHTVNNYSTNNPEAFTDEVSIIDREWISSRFLVPNTDLAQIDRINRFFSTTGWKFNSTQLGANIAINARPQFTRYADIRGNNRTLLSSGLGDATAEIYSRPVTLGMTTDIGIGRYYSESLDDNATLVFLEFGVPKFNNLFTYFVRAITYEDMYIANHGTTPTGYTLGKIGGAIINLYFFPLTTIIIYGYKAIAGFFMSGPLDYYYFSSAMAQYWATANTILNKIAVELGLICPLFDDTSKDGKSSAEKIGAQATIDHTDFKILSTIIPGAFYPSTNYIDLTYIAARPQILANRMASVEYKEFKNKENNIPSYIGYVTDGKQWKEKNLPGSSATAGLDNALKVTNITDFFKKYIMVDKSEYHPIDPSVPDQPQGNQGQSSESFDYNQDVSNGETKNSRHPDGAIRKTPGFWDSLFGKVLENAEHRAEVFDATTREGAKYAVFSVDFQGSVSESVGNSISDIELGGILKGAGGAARNLKFNLAGGNIIPGVAELGDMLKNFAAGALESITFGLSNVISTLMGNAFIEFPKKWDDSEMSFPTVTYNMTLISPYGNTISQLQNIYIPLAMLLAGSLPLATGERSYTSPFLCRLFNKGIQNIKLGMITSLSITRGSSNLPFSRWKKPLAVEVSFTVTDFSTIMAAPINSSVFGGEFNMRLTEDTKFDEYIGILCGKDLYTDLYFLPKLKKKISRLAMALTQTFIGTNTSASLGQNPLFGLLGMFTKERNIGSNQNNNIYF